MTDFTERSLSTQTVTERTALGTIAFTARGSYGTTFVIMRGSSVTDTVAPVISNVHADAIYTTSAVLSWDTDKEANCCVIYTKTSSADTDDWGRIATHEHYIILDHVCTLAGLSKDSVYYFYAESADINGNAAQSEIYNFETAGDSGIGKDPVMT